MHIFMVICLLFSSLFISPEQAMSGITVGAPLVSDAPDYSDIIFYHDCDALDDANKAGGSATVSYDGGILLETTDPILGTGSWDNNNDGFDDLRFAISGNVDFSGGRIGFYFQPQETAGDEILYTNGSDLILRKNNISGAQDNFSLYYLGSSILNTGPTINALTTYFIELEFNGSSVTLYVDNTEYLTVTGTGNVDDVNLHFYSTDGIAWDSFIDQVISSNDPDRSLHAVRDVTDFS